MVLSSDSFRICKLESKTKAMKQYEPISLPKSAFHFMPELDQALDTLGIKDREASQSYVENLPEGATQETLSKALNAVLK